MPERPWKRPALIVLGAVVLLALLFVLLWPGTTWWVEHVDGVDLDGKDLEAGKDRQDLLDKARGRLTALATGVLAAIAIVYTASNAKSARRVAEASQETAQAAARTAAATEQGLVTGRYTAAIEQLGSDKLDIRLGGVYALERIARDSERDQPTVMAVLAAFVREHSHDENAHTTRTNRTGDEAREAPASRNRFRPDLQDALTVIGRRNPDHDADPINLSGADLHRANLNGADLNNADLNGADLSDADLREAQLRGAKLSGANLSGANLYDANLYWAGLSGADLRDANLSCATLYGANLGNADLRGARLIKVDDLNYVILGGADLSSADLRDTGMSEDDIQEKGVVFDEHTRFGPLPEDPWDEE